MNMDRSLVGLSARTGSRNMIQANSAAPAWEAPLCHAIPASRGAFAAVARVIARRPNRPRHIGDPTTRTTPPERFAASATMPVRIARVAELVDARDLKSRIRKGVRVRFPSRAPHHGGQSDHGPSRRQRSESAQQNQPRRRICTRPDNGVLQKLAADGTGVVQRDARHQKTRFTGPLALWMYAHSVERLMAARCQHTTELRLSLDIGTSVYRLAVWVACRDECAAVDRQGLMQGRQAIGMDIGVQHHGMRTQHAIVCLPVGLYQCRSYARCCSHDTGKEGKLEARPGVEPG